jgi:hypothetical protein
VAWGGAGSNFDRIHVITTGDIPDGDESDEEVDDSTMHPEHQIALGGVMEIYTYPGMILKLGSCCIATNVQCR